MQPFGTHVLYSRTFVVVLAVALAYHRNVQILCVDYTTVNYWTQRSK